MNHEIDVKESDKILAIQNYAYYLSQNPEWMHSQWSMDRDELDVFMNNYITENEDLLSDPRCSQNTKAVCRFLIVVNAIQNWGADWNDQYDDFVSDLTISDHMKVQVTQDIFSVLLEKQDPLGIDNILDVILRSQWSTLFLATDPRSQWDFSITNAIIFSQTDTWFRVKDSVSQKDLIYNWDYIYDTIWGNML